MSIPAVMRDQYLPGQFEQPKQNDAGEGVTVRRTFRTENHKVPSIERERVPLKRQANAAPEDIRFNTLPDY